MTFPEPKKELPIIQYGFNYHGRNISRISRRRHALSSLSSVPSDRLSVFISAAGQTGWRTHTEAIAVWVTGPRRAAGQTGEDSLPVQQQRKVVQTC